MLQQIAGEHDIEAGHEQAAFENALVRKNVTNGILWTVRREHWLQ